MLPDNVITSVRDYAARIAMTRCRGIDPDLADDFAQDVVVAILEHSQDAIQQCYERGGLKEVYRYTAGVVVRMYKGKHKCDYKRKYGQYINPDKTVTNGQNVHSQRASVENQSTTSKYTIKDTYNAQLYLTLCTKIEQADEATDEPILLAIKQLPDPDKHLYLQFVAFGGKITAMANHHHCSTTTLRNLIFKIEVRINEYSKIYDFTPLPY